MAKFQFRIEVTEGEIATDLENLTPVTEIAKLHTYIEEIRKVADMMEIMASGLRSQADFLSKGGSKLHHEQDRKKTLLS